MSEEFGRLPTIDEVLDELKSNGTFDQFRKSCLACVQAEPSFRAYGEHIEVVSRRYLQNFKWRESTTKNEVRTRLKDHALRVIESPDIQVGVPFSALVEKAMETQGKELLPKIEEVVTALQQAKKIPIHGNKTVADTKEEVEEESNVQKTGLEFDLTLPIDLPGLTPAGGVRRDSIKKDSALLKKESTLSESTARSVKIKPKLNDLKSVSKQKSEGKPQSEIVSKQDKEGSQKPPPLQLEVKKDSKLKSVKRKRSREEILDAGSHSHGKQKELDLLGVVSEKHREMNDNNKRDGMTRGSSQRLDQKECSTVSRKEKLVSEINLREKMEVPAHADRDVSMLGEMKTEEKQAPMFDESKTSLKESSFDQSSSCGSLKIKKSEFIPLEEDTVMRDEQCTETLPPRCKSARLGSFSDDQGKGESCQDEEEAARVENFYKKSGKVKVAKTNRSSRRIGGSSFRRHGRGVAHLDSSSEDEYIGRSSHSAEKFMVEADEKRHSSSKRSGHRKRSFKLDNDSLRSGSHIKRARTLSRTGSPASTGSSSSSTMNQEGQVLGQHHKVFKEYSKQPAGYLRGKSKSRSPTPVVVTRFNRCVKPNRRYCESDEEPMIEEEANENHQTGKKLNRWSKTR